MRAREATRRIRTAVLLLLAGGTSWACSDDDDAMAADGTTSGAMQSTGVASNPATGSTRGETSSSSSADTSSSLTTSDDGPLPDVPPPVVPGLRQEIWDAYLDRVDVQVVPTLEADWGVGSPAADVAEDFFSVRWSGWLTPSLSGAHTIITDTDDGVRVWVDDALVIDDWTPHFVTRNEAIVELQAGVDHEIRIDYFEIDIDASAALRWIPPGAAEELVPVSALSTIEVPGPDEPPKPPYRNPVVPFDCPDPGVLAAPDARLPGYYMVCTGGTIPIRYSRDLVHWHGTFSAVLPDGKPAWADNGFRNWAPELHYVGDRVVAYYTTVDAQDRLCIGYATADDPLGPYVESPGPMVTDPLGVIDASYTFVDGTHWLSYKIDGNAHGQPTPIYIRELAPDGLSFAKGSAPIEVLRNNPSNWEGGVVEAQYFAQHDGMLYMFYSGNVFDHRYRTSVARAPSMVGPWEKLGPPILTNNARWVGPGHGTVLQVDGLDYFFYHAWTNAGDGTHLQAQGRHGLIDRIDWVDGWPTISDGAASTTLQPWPGVAPPG